MILIIDTCKERLSYFEFVRPIEDIVKKGYITKYYLDIKEQDLEKADKIIITGTSLKDNGLLDNIDSFCWLKRFKKPVLGICAGIEIIGLIFCCTLRRGVEVGLKKVNFEGEFLGLQGKQNVYAIHVFSLENNEELTKTFEVRAKNRYVQAIKHKKRPIYGVLFHPEVRNKEMIKRFLEI